MWHRGHSGAYVGQWEGLAGAWAFEKVLEICRRVKTVPLKPKGTAPELVQPGRVCATRLPAQPVDATPSNALIRQCFPGRSDLFGCPRSKPSQGSVPADLTLASDLAFVFNASRVRLECCVDPLRPPRLSGTRQVVVMSPFINGESRAISSLEYSLRGRVVALTSLDVESFACRAYFHRVVSRIAIVSTRHIGQGVCMSGLFCNL